MSKLTLRAWRDSTAPSIERNLFVARHLGGWRMVRGAHPDVGPQWGAEPLWVLPADMTVDDVPYGGWTDSRLWEQPAVKVLTIFDVLHYLEDSGVAWKAMEGLLRRGQPSINNNRRLHYTLKVEQEGATWEGEAEYWSVAITAQGALGIFAQEQTLVTKRWELSDALIEAALVTIGALLP